MGLGQEGEGGAVRKGTAKKWERVSGLGRQLEVGKETGTKERGTEGLGQLRRTLPALGILDEARNGVE